MYKYAQDGGAAMGVLPREVCFDCAGPVIKNAFWDAGGLAKWLTRFQNIKPKTANPAS